MQMGPSGSDVCDLRGRAPQGPGRLHDMATGDLCEPACHAGNLAGARLRVVAGWHCRRNPKRRRGATACLTGQRNRIRIREDVSVYEAEGKTLQKLSRHREAIACADKALRLNPGSASAHRIKGKLLQRLGEHRKAIACFDREIGLDPQGAFAHAAKGKSLQILGEHREAMACFDVAAGPNPDYSFAHATKGQSLQALGRHREAIACLDVAIGLRCDS